MNKFLNDAENRALNLINMLYTLHTCERNAKKFINKLLWVFFSAKLLIMTPQ